MCTGPPHTILQAKVKGGDPPLYGDHFEHNPSANSPENLQSLNCGSQQSAKLTNYYLQQSRES